MVIMRPFNLCVFNPSRSGHKQMFTYQYFATLLPYTLQKHVGEMKYKFAAFVKKKYGKLPESKHAVSPDGEQISHEFQVRNCDSVILTFFRLLI